MPRPNRDQLADALLGVFATVRGDEELVNVPDALLSLAAAVNYRGKEVVNAVEALAAAMTKLAATLEKQP
jgi:hypothetical protein